MSALDRVLSHYSGLSRRSVQVPEWTREGEPPFTIWWRPWTLLQRQEAQKRVAENDMASYFAQILVMKAEDESGAPLFTRRDLPKLSSGAHEKVMERVASAISSDMEYYVPLSERLEEAKGN